ncbi:prenyltransferase/squalene oxidase repeat-containing protein [Maioricimonas sp. JC845]|uniref:prenyltransferase/squalene oxidase repeat-containing protein n=1 Tax=Maioricimonas sp. JC845 TaxID=3232138 RepID=UPI00345800A3
MTQPPYLIALGQRLTDGLAGLASERRDRHRAFIGRFRQPDGGYSGREGDSDLYYTSFAVRSLALLGGVDASELPQLTEYLRGHDWQRLGVIDLMNWLSLVLAVQTFGGEDLLADAGADWPDRISAQLESVRTADGGYAKSPEGASGSTYHTFLVLLSYELIGRTPSRPNDLIQFLYDRQRDDGGFVEIAPMRRSGTNPTAAASATLQRLGGMDEDLKADICGFLGDVYSMEGGFQANGRIPFADGLSTFTALLTALDIGCPHLVDRQKLEHFVVEVLERPDGGFRAAGWDDAADVEYTFYGLGLLALLNELPAP